MHPLQPKAGCLTIQKYGLGNCNQTGANETRKIVGTTQILKQTVPENIVPPTYSDREQQASAKGWDPAEYEL